MCLTKGNLTSCRSETHYSLAVFLNTPVHFLFFILFIFAFRDKPAQWWGCCGITGSLLRLVNRHAHPACPAASFLGGWGGKHWETSLELLLIPNIMFLLCAQNHTPVFQKKLRILSQTWRQRWRRVRERKKEEKTLVTWRGKIVHRAAVMLVQKAREGNKQKHIEGGRGWKRMRDACTVI